MRRRSRSSAKTTASKRGRKIERARSFRRGRNKAAIDAGPGERDQLPRESLEARHRALFAQIFQEAGMEPDEMTVAALVGAMRSLGLTIRPLVTRF